MCLENIYLSLHPWPSWHDILFQRLCLVDLDEQLSSLVQKSVFVMLDVKQAISKKITSITYKLSFWTATRLSNFAVSTISFDLAFISALNAATIFSSSSAIIGFRTNLD